MYVIIEIYFERRPMFLFRFYIYDCDDFTEKYFAHNLGLEDLPRERKERLPPPGQKTTDIMMSLHVTTVTLFSHHRAQHSAAPARRDLNRSRRGLCAKLPQTAASSAEEGPQQVPPVLGQGELFVNHDEI